MATYIDVSRVPDARVGRHEEDEDTRGKEDGDDAANGLGVELLVRWRLEEETNAEVADKSSSDISSTGSVDTGDQVDALGLGDGVAVLGDTTVDELRCLGRSSQGSDVGDGTTVDGQEGEDDTENAGEDGEASVHVVLNVADNGGNGSEGEGTDDPDPGGDLLAGGRKVLNEDRVARALGNLLLEELVALAALLEVVVDGDGALVGSELDTVPQDTEVQKELSHGVDNEDHDTGPEEPVTRRGNVARSTDATHGVEGVPALPLGVLGKLLETNALAVVDEKGTDETEGEDGTAEPRDGSVETDEDTRTEESGSQLDVPTPVVDVLGPVAVAAPDVEPGEDVPVVQDAISVLRDNDVNKGTEE